jgi:hypothetical protein
MSVSASEARRQYLAMIRTNYPRLYNDTVLKTVEKHLQKQQALGALSTDYGADLSAFDLTSGDAAVYTPTDYSTPDTSTVTSSISDNSGSLFSSILNSVSSIANSYTTTAAQQNLLQINTQRAKQGLPPLTYYNGQQVTAAGLAPASPSVNGVETALSSIPSSTWLYAGLGVAAIFLISSMKRK